MGHRPQALREGDSDADSTASDSSGSSYRTSKRRRKRPAAATDSDTSNGISPTILVLAILLIAASGAAVYFAMESRRIPDSGANTNTGQGTAIQSLGGTGLTGQVTVTEIVVSVTAAPSAGPEASTDQGATPSLADSPKSGASSKTNDATNSKDNAGTAAPAPTTTGDGGGDSTDPFVRDCLSEHNTFRGTHHAEPLVWNTTIQTAAQKWADHCVWEHSGGKVGPYGENLNEEEKMYDYSKPTGFTHETGHFTQTVWKGTKQLGCAFARCDGIIGKGVGAFLVCEYWPGGNMVGSDNKSFRENVLPP
ncbi:PR-1-like protein [Rhodotorula sp. JG-1b]|nr:PR-1-like protein [Rhodotorula sp. JG-1b]